MLDRITDRSVGGRYLLGPRLGGGGTSDVYRAVDIVLERPVAVKLFRPCADPTAECRFQAEARLLAPLVHPALVTIYDSGIEGGRAYQVLQLVDGRTLRDRLVDGPLEPHQAARIGVRLAAALAYVHRRGIVHRDVKPSNVLDDGERVYLADFGSSRLLNDAHLTLAGLAVGTAAYMAPEQVRGQEVGPAADVYSLGLVLLECLTGHREYSGPVTEAAMARLSRPPLVSTRFPAPLPSPLAAMTRDDPRQRPSAEACAAALRDGTQPSTRPSTQPFAARPATAADLDDTDAFPVPFLAAAGRPTRGVLRTGFAALAVVLTLMVGALALVESHRPGSTPAKITPGPTATVPGEATPTPGPNARTRRPGAAVPAPPSGPPPATHVTRTASDSKADNEADDKAGPSNKGRGKKGKEPESDD